MIITDPIKEFYAPLLHERVLVLVAMDVDALCASRILQTLFQIDHVRYTVVPVSGPMDLESCLVEHLEQVQHVVLINCGATFDVVEAMQQSDDVIFYVIDSHRPLDVCNVYNSRQVKLLVHEKEKIEYPEFEEVFRDEDEDEDDEAEDGSGGDRLERMEARVAKRQAKRNWEQNKIKILFEYEQFSFTGYSSALTLYDLARKMSKDNNELLWMAIVGVTEQFINSKVDQDTYCEVVHGTLQSHVSRLNAGNREEQAAAGVSINCLRISFEEDLNLMLYRHWTVYDSLTHSPATACQFKIWKLKGQSLLHEFLAAIGLPLVQCRQKYHSMDSSVRGEVKSMISEGGAKFNISNLLFPTFVANFGFKHRFSAADVVLAATAIVENNAAVRIANDVNANTESDPATAKTSDHKDLFLLAMDCLNHRSKPEILDRGLQLAVTHAEYVRGTIQQCVDLGQIVNSGPFLYAQVEQGAPGLQVISHPLGIVRLSNFLLQAFVRLGGKFRNKFKNLPLIVVVPRPLSYTESAEDSSQVVEDEVCVIVGIPPLGVADEKRNFFGKAFQQAVEKTEAEAFYSFFDSNIIQLKSKHKAKFFNALVAMLE